MKDRIWLLGPLLWALLMSGWMFLFILALWICVEALIHMDNNSTPTQKESQ